MELLIVGLVIGVSCFVAWIVYDVMRTGDAVNSIEERILGLSDFDAADIYISWTSLTGVAIDKGRREFLLVDEGSPRRFRLSSIVSCEIVEDGVQLASTDRGSQLAGIAVGGMLAGGVGAVIGGLSGSRRSTSYVKKVFLRFITDDFDRPNHDIVLLDRSYDKTGVERDHSDYKEALETAELWHGRVLAMLNAGERQLRW